MSLRDDILGTDDLERTQVEVPEWPCKVVTIRSLTGAERDSLAELAAKASESKVMERLADACMKLSKLGGAASEAALKN